MSKGSSGTQVSKSEPWSAQQPYLRSGFQAAEQNFNSPGPQYYPNATYTPFSPQSEMAMGMMQNRAINGSPVESGMQDYVTRTMQNPGGQPTQMALNRQMFNMPTLGQTSGYADAQDPSAYRGFLSNQNGQTPNFAGDGANVQNNLMGTANGQYLGANPYLDQQYNSAARRVTENFNDAVMPGLNATFAGAGGSGSQIHRELALDSADELGQNLSDLAGNMYGNNYQQERDRQLQASGLLSQDDLSRRGLNADVYNQGQGRMLDAGRAGLTDNLDRLRLGGDLYNQSSNRTIDAANASTGLLSAQHDAASGAASMAPQAAGLDYLNIANLGQVGDQVEGKGQEVLNDYMNRWNFYQQQPDDRLANYIAAIQGNYGGIDRSGTLQSPGAGAAGGAIAGASAGSKVGGGWGALAGALIGGYSGYSGAKKNNNTLKN